MGNLGGGLVQQRPDPFVVALDEQGVGGLDQVVGVVSSLGRVGRVVERELDVLGLALELLDGDRQRDVHPGLAILRPSLVQVAEQRGMNVGELLDLRLSSPSVSRSCSEDSSCLR